MANTDVGIRLSLQGEQQVKASLAAVEQGIERMGTGLGKLAHYGTALLLIPQGLNGTVGAAVRAADAVTILNNQLKLATGSTQAAAKAYTALFDIAQRSRVSFTELGGTFASISRAGEALGVSQTRLLGITEAISNAVAISGGSAESARASLVQLSQGLASGTLRGDELNSVMEQTPRLAKALADGLGVSTGELRKLGEQGKITAASVITALESQSKVLSTEVKDSVVTVGQAFTQLQNATTLAVGEFDKASGTSAALASALQGVASTVQTVGKAFKDNETAVQTTIGAIAGLASAAIIGRLAAVAAGIGSVSGALVTLRVAVAALNPWTLALLAGGAAVGAAVASDNQYRKTADGLRATIAELEKLNTSERAKFSGAGGNPDTNKRFNQAVAERLEKITTLRSALDKLAEKDREAFAPIGSVGSGDTALRRELARQEAAKPTVAVKKPTGLSDAEKGLALYNDEMAKASGLNADFSEKWGLLGAAFKAHKISVDDLTAAQAALLKEQTFSKDTAKEWEEQTKASNKAVAESVKEYERLVDGYQKSAGAQAAQVQQLQDEEQAVAIAAAQNVSLAQAIELVTIARLEESQAKAYANGEQEAGDAIKQEIANRQQLVSLIGGKEARAANTKAAKDAANEWKKAADKINDSITDALMRGFESGKGFAENLRDTVVNMFKTMVLRPIISAIVNPVAGALTGALGLSGAANAAGAVNGAGGAGNIGLAAQLKSTYDTVTGAFASLGDKVAFVAEDVGAWLVNNTTGALNEFGSTLMTNSSAIGTAGAYAGGALAGYGIGTAVSGTHSAFGDGNGDTAVVAGTAIGAIFGGPVGAAIGGAIGGLVNRAFGDGAKEYAGSGITGTLAGTSFVGQSYTDWRKEAGWFSSGSQGTDYRAMGSGQSEALGSAFASVTGQVAGFADALGLSAGTVLGFTKQIRLALGSDAEANKAAIAAMFKGIADEAAATVLDAKYIREGETAAITLQRMATHLGAVNDSFDIMGKSLLVLSAVSGDLASQLADAFGGLEKYQGAITTYYQRYYSKEEQFAKAREKLQESLSALGLSMPTTIAAYRDLVTAQDVTTASGMQTYAALISLSGVFADVTESATSMGDTIASAFKDISKTLADLITNIQGQRAKNTEAAASLSPAAVTESAIRTGIDTALSGIVAPTTASVVAAIQRKIAADNTALTASAAVSVTKYATDKVSAATSGRDATLAQYNASAAAAAATPTTVRLHGVRGTWWGGSEGYDYDAQNPNYAPAQAAAAQSLLTYNAALANFTQTVATYGAVADQGTIATNTYNAALAERAAAENAIKSAQTAYTNELRTYVLSASTGLEKLALLREKTLEYYQQQKAIADLLANSASSLRQSMQDALFGTLTPERQQQQLQGEFSTAYALAQVSSGEALAGYADQLGALLPRITAGLGDTATSAADYASKSGALTSQISAIADRLDAQSSVNYLQTSVDLLTLIDNKMAVLEATSTSAQALIVAAIDAGALRTADGLQQVINALTGRSVAAFALGGSHLGGLRIVGENGPELEATGPSRIWNAADTRSMLSGRGGDAATADELRQLRMDMRAAQAQTAALMSRLVKLNEKWDGDGLPSTRTEAA